MNRDESSVSLKPFAMCVAAILLSIAGPWTTSARGQGKLARFRNAVHQHRSSGNASKKTNDPPKNVKKRNDNRHDDANRHRQSRDRIRVKRRPPSFGIGGFSFGSPCIVPCPPTTVVHVVQPPVVETVFVSPATSGQFLATVPTSPPVVNQPIIEAPIPPADYGPTLTAPDSSESMMSEAIYEMPPQEAMVLGGDWFANWKARGQAVYGGGVDQLTVAGLDLLIQSPGGPGLESSVKTWRESTNLTREHLWLGDANLVYEIASHRNVRARLGIGLNWANDHWGGSVGFNMTAGTDIRLSERWLLSGQTDIGTLGSSDFLHAQLAIARRFNSSELMFGYDFYDVGGVRLQGMFGGLQFRF